MCAQVCLPRLTNLRVTNSGPELLSYDDKNVNEVASKFIDNTHQLRIILSSYVMRWCHATRGVDDSTGHDVFLDETREIFRLVNDRMNLEKNKLFPLFM